MIASNDEPQINIADALAQAGRNTSGRAADRPRSLREKSGRKRDEPDLRLRFERRTVPRDGGDRQ